MSKTILQRTGKRTRNAQADLSLCWAHMPFRWFCHEAADLGIGRQQKRWEDIKECTGMWFGDSLRATEDGKVERYCCNIVCGAPTTI